jgi:hypothetical protein
MFFPSAAPASGGGTKNYLGTVNGTNSNGDFETGSTSPWVKGNVSALTNSFPSNTSPTFGSGASANLTLSIVSSSQLAGTYSLSFASSAATVQGDFLASSAITLDKEDQAKQMQFRFYFSAITNPTNATWSGTTTNSFGVAIWDVTNSAWIQPTGVFSMIQSSGVGVASGTWQTPSNMTQFRFVVYNANATSNSITLYFDDFFCGPQVSASGAYMSDWASYTPTGAWSANTTYTGFWRREGDSMRVAVRMALAGAPTSASLTVNLPTGYTIDTTKLNSTTREPVGDGETRDDSAAAAYPVYVRYNSTTSVSVFSANSTTNPTISTVTQAAPFTYANLDTVDINFLVPISGWSSNVLYSSDGGDGRLVALRAYGAPPTGTLNSSDNTTIFGTSEQDTHAAYSTATGVYTVPVTGTYLVSALLTYGWTSASVANVNRAKIAVNGTVKAFAAQQIGSTSQTSMSVPVTATVACNAGDTITILSSSTTTTPVFASTTYACYFTADKLASPAAIASSETVSMRYFSSSTSISSSLATITYATKDWDTHNAYSSGTFTVPVSGKYIVTAQIKPAATFTLNNNVIIELQKNGTVVTRETVFAAAAVTDLNAGIWDHVSCVAGDTLRIQVSCSGTGPSIASSNFENYLSLTKVGN